MTERVKSKRAPKKKSGMGGARPGAGRKKGGISKIARLAQKKAKDRHGILPAELLHEWAVEGKMLHGGKYVQLDVKDRIDAAKACARFFSPQLSAQKVVGDAQQPIRAELDVNQLMNTASSLDQLHLLREILVMLSQDGGAAIQNLTQGQGADPARYAKLVN